MTLASEVEAIGGLLKKYYESGPARKQFWADHQITRRLYKNTRDIQGGTATVGLHVGRNSGVASAANGESYGTPGKQTFNQTTVPLKYLYMPTRFSGPDIANSRGNAAAFANVMTANMDGALNDGKADLNRQLFSDGSGILCFLTGDPSTVTATIEPYLWGPANKYVDIAGLEIEGIKVSDGLTNLTARTRATAAVVSSTAIASATTCTITTTGQEIATGADGDAIGKYGALMYSNGTLFNDYECMSLNGGIHNTDPIGSTAYKYDAGDAGNPAVANFTGPESQSHDWAVGSLTRTFQGIATASYGWWKSTVYGNGGVPRALSFSLLDNMLATLRVTKGAKTSAIYTTWQVNQKLVDLIRADRRYPDTMELDGGLKVNSYQGVPIIVDNDCPRGMAFFVDESEIAMYVKEDFTFIKDGQGNNMFKISGYDGYEVTGKVYCNLGFMNRNKHGKIIDILES